MWNVREMAQSLFYQLALLQFGGLVSAQLKERVNLTTVMAYALQLEEEQSDDDSDSNSIGETNLELAQQAATCLLDHSEMLAEYFSIILEREGEVVWLTSLPVLLEGHEPSPGGLSVFLLRLATEVEWTQERSCFEGICRELGSYYAVSEKNIQHTMFPAISFLLTPTPRVEAFMRKITVLSELYKAFER
jgi:DNA mismatch repair protein MLH1